jgi:hypothetical protein
VENCETRDSGAMPPGLAMRVPAPGLDDQVIVTASRAAGPAGRSGERCSAESDMRRPSPVTRMLLSDLPRALYCVSFLALSLLRDK